MVVDPVTPFVEIGCPALISDRSERSDLDFVVLGDVDEAELSGFRVFVSKPNVAAASGNGLIAERSEDLHDFSSGERRSNHSSPHELGEILDIVAFEVVRVDVELVAKKLVRVVDRLATPLV